MKLLFLLLPILLFSNMLKLYIITMLSMLMILMIKSFNNSIMMNNQFLLMDSLSYIMMMLTIISTMLILLSSTFMEEIMILIPLIFSILMITFSLSNMFNFYIMFELVLIPTMILITKYGKQPERLQASIYLLIYTVTASLPLLISILFMKNNMSFMIMNMYMYKFNLIILLMMAFLVKLPMFFFHMWLPKAHVEAPLEGSMILAAILLKLGGYGLIRFLPICLSKISKLNMWIISISLVGASITSMNCIRQKDLKSLIAYSSVAHMALVIASILSMNYIGFLGAIMMMIAHGLSSSALFLLVNDLYLKIHSRNIMLFKGLMTISPNISFWWFIYMAINISAPPSINTISEIFIMSSLIMWTKSMIIPIMITSFLTASFSISMFINMNHNKNFMNPFHQSNPKIYLSLMIHMIPLIMMLMKMESMLF